MTPDEVVQLLEQGLVSNERQSSVMSSSVIMLWDGEWQPFQWRSPPAAAGETVSHPSK